MVHVLNKEEFMANLLRDQKNRKTREMLIKEFEWLSYRNEKDKRIKKLMSGRRY